MSFGVVVTPFSLIRGLGSKQINFFPYLLHSGSRGCCRPVFTLLARSHAMLPVYLLPMLPSTGN
ncbi:rCG45957, partial [Rattus norvegicus]